MALTLLMKIIGLVATLSVLTNLSDAAPFNTTVTTVIERDATNIGVRRPIDHNGRSNDLRPLHLRHPHHHASAYGHLYLRKPSRHREAWCLSHREHQNQHQQYGGRPSYPCPRRREQRAPQRRLRRRYRRTIGSVGWFALFSGGIGSRWSAVWRFSRWFPARYTCRSCRKN
jgi:hypothetical protein